MIRHPPSPPLFPYPPLFRSEGLWSSVSKPFISGGNRRKRNGRRELVLTSLSCGGSSSLASSIAFPLELGTHGAPSPAATVASYARLRRPGDRTGGTCFGRSVTSHCMSKTTHSFRRSHMGAPTTSSSPFPLVRYAFMVTSSHPRY